MRLVINAESNEGRKNNTSTKSDHQAARPADGDKRIHWHLQTRLVCTVTWVCVCVYTCVRCLFITFHLIFDDTLRATEKKNKEDINRPLSLPFIFSFHIQLRYHFYSQSHAPASKSGHISPWLALSSPRPLVLSQPFSVWLTEIPEIQADGSSPWLMMSPADPFLCPLRSRSNPRQFPYVLHDKSHHAFLLTLLGPLIHSGLSPPEPGFGRTRGGFGRVNRKLRGRKRMEGGGERRCLVYLRKVFNQGIKLRRRRRPQILYELCWGIIRGGDLELEPLSSGYVSRSARPLCCDT